VTNYSVLVLGFALGMRHGVDADHLAAIDGLARVHPRSYNGLLFAVGHGSFVTLLAVGIGSFFVAPLTALAPWLLILLGTVNVWRLLRPQPVRPVPLISTSPFILGIVFAAGFETASQISTFALANQLEPWILGLIFTLGMVIVDGTDGFLAARIQQVASAGGIRSQRSSRILSIVIIFFSFGIGIAELLGSDFEIFALPMGLGLFALLMGLRWWSLQEAAQG
jgi:nickel/cobalt transporter (NiCoT) family protein